MVRNTQNYASLLLWLYFQWIRPSSCLECLINESFLFNLSEVNLSSIENFFRQRHTETTFACGGSLIYYHRPQSLKMTFGLKKRRRSIREAMSVNTVVETSIIFDDSVENEFGSYIRTKISTICYSSDLCALSTLLNYLSTVIAINYRKLQENFRSLIIIENENISACYTSQESMSNYCNGATCSSTYSSRSRKFINACEMQRTSSLPGVSFVTEINSNEEKISSSMQQNGNEIYFHFTYWCKLNYCNTDDRGSRILTVLLDHYDPWKTLNHMPTEHTQGTMAFEQLMRTIFQTTTTTTVQSSLTTIIHMSTTTPVITTTSITLTTTSISTTFTTLTTTSISTTFTTLTSTTTTVTSSLVSVESTKLNEPETKPLTLIPTLPSISNSTKPTSTTKPNRNTTNNAKTNAFCCEVCMVHLLNVILMLFLF